MTALFPIIRLFHLLFHPLVRCLLNSYTAAPHLLVTPHTILTTYVLLALFSSDPESASSILFLYPIVVFFGRLLYCPSADSEKGQSTHANPCMGAFSHSAGTARTRANYYVVSPGNTPEKHSPVEGCMIN